MTTRTVDFYFDFGSPASYLAATQLPKLCVDAGAELVWKPMLLGGVFQATGNHSPATIPAKAPYVFTDFARFARRYGVPIKLVLRAKKRDEVSPPVDDAADTVVMSGDEVPDPPSKSSE